MTIASFQNWYTENKEEILKDFFTFLRFPSISTDPKHEQDVRKTAAWLCDYMKQIGLDVEIWETSGLPSIFGTHLKAGPGRPTLLIYHHYDVQPVDPIELWDSPPFEPVVKNNSVYARGAQDNKGQCFYSITAIRAFLSLVKEVGINLKVFIEGEEESGGHGTTEIVAKRKEELKADYLLIIDTGLPKRGEPGITLGTRGVLSMEVELKNSNTDLHSGSHGGIALNPNRALVSVLAKLWDASGRVTVPGFYDAVKEADKGKFDPEFDLEAYKKAYGVKAFAAEKGFSLIETNWLRPVLEINGISGGYAGAGFKTVIPSKAIAKLSCRLVPDQDPAKIYQSIVQFLQNNIPEGMELKMHFYHGAPAFRSQTDAPIVKIVAQAYEEVFKKKCRYLLDGASIPIVVDLTKASGAQTVLMGFGLGEDNIHAPNEHFGLDRFEMGCITVGRLLALLSEGSF